MLTKRDISILKSTFVTKEEHMATTKDIIDLISAYRIELKTDISDLRKELKSEISNLRTELKGEMLSFKDAIITEIRAMRQELEFVVGYRGTIEDHEERIATLEMH